MTHVRSDEGAAMKRISELVELGRSKQHHRKIELAGMNYTAFCLAAGCAKGAFPVHFEGVARLMEYRVAIHGLAPDSADSFMSELRTYARERSLGWDVSETEALLIRDLKRGLQLRYTGQGKKSQKPLFREYHARRILAAEAGDNSAACFSELTQMPLGLKAFLRTGENVKLKRQHVVFLRAEGAAEVWESCTGLRLLLVNTKTGLLDPGRPQEVVIPRTTGGADDVVKRMWDLLHVGDLLQRGGEPGDLRGT